MAWRGCYFPWTAYWNAIVNINAIPKSLKIKSQWLTTETIGIAEETKEANKARKKSDDLMENFKGRQEEIKKTSLITNVAKLSKTAKRIQKTCLEQLKKSVRSSNTRTGTSKRRMEHYCMTKGI